MSGEKLAADLVSEIHVHMASIQPQIEAVAKQVSCRDVGLPGLHCAAHARLMQVHVKQVLTGIDANAVADEALGKLDSNNDGKVTRDEFILNFLAVMQDVRGWQRLCVQLSHTPIAPPPTHRSLTPNRSSSPS